MRYFFALFFADAQRVTCSCITKQSGHRLATRSWKGFNQTRPLIDWTGLLQIDTFGFVPGWIWAGIESGRIGPVRYV